MNDAEVIKKAATFATLRKTGDPVTEAQLTAMLKKLPRRERTMAIKRMRRGLKAAR